MQISVEWTQNRGASVSAVIAGLDPAIHPFAKMMDPRVKPAGDASDGSSSSEHDLEHVPMKLLHHPLSLPGLTPKSGVPDFGAFK